MRLLPSETKEAIEVAFQEFKESGKLDIFEPCNCGSHIQHNNGGNYHQEIYLQRDGDQVFVKYDTTCELTSDPECELCDDWKNVIRENADWL